MDFKKISRFDNLSVPDFKKNFLKKKKPIIISKSFDWQASQKWNIEYLKAFYPEKTAVVTVISDNQEKTNTNVKNIELKLPEALDLLFDNSDQNKRYLLLPQSIDADFPELLTDIDVPKYEDKKREHVTNLCIGKSDINTMIHYDTSNSFITQIVGRKRIRLFAPTDSYNMYPYAINDVFLDTTPSVYMSRIRGTDLINYNEFPKMKMVTCFEGILYPGDLLFIPAGWWHEIKYIDISISVNFLWKIRIEDFSQQSTNLICSFFHWYADIFDEVVKDHFDFFGFQNDIQVAEFFLLKGLKCIAAIFLLNYLNKLDFNENLIISNKVNHNDHFMSLREEIRNWREYLEIAKKENDSFFEDEKIIYIINKVKSLC
jgi:hypothetical protein